MEKSKRVVGYARVSTEAQDITRQIELITAYCSDRNYHLIKIIQEKISGARKDRKSLNELLDVDDAVADMIIVSELSRLSREDDILSVLSTINELLKQGVDILFLDKQDRIYKAGTILSLYDINYAVSRSQSKCRRTLQDCRSDADGFTLQTGRV